MKVERPGLTRSTIVDGPAGLEITIPTRRNLFFVAFVGFWLCGWLAGEVAVPIVLLTQGPGPEDFFLIAWLGGWTTAGAFIWYAWLNQLTGREFVKLNGTLLTVGMRVARLRWTALRRCPSKGGRQGWRRW